MTRDLHLVKLTHGRYVNLAGITTVGQRDGSVTVWFRGENDGETLTGQDAEIVARRLEALALIATTEIEADIASIPLPPGAVRPTP